ncbi:hypothetical protein EYV94_08125 [Puteibacter caeruleilacunae]|nr:hypothetical protein EYV94_08125 [Puteibacter caeruleilacunae]
MLCPDEVKVVKSLVKLFDCVRQIDGYARNFYMLSFNNTVSETDWFKDVPELLAKMNAKALDWIYRDPNVWNNIKTSIEKCTTEFGLISAKNKLYVSRGEWINDLYTLKDVIADARKASIDAINKAEDHHEFLKDLCKRLGNRINHGDYIEKYQQEEFCDPQALVTLKMVHQMLVIVTELMESLYRELLEIHPIWDELSIKIDSIQVGLEAKNVPSSFCDLLNFKQASSVWLYIKTKLEEKEALPNCDTSVPFNKLFATNLMGSECP